MIINILIDLENQSNYRVFRNTPEYNVKSLFYGENGTKRTCQFTRDGFDKIVVN